MFEISFQIRKDYYEERVHAGPQSKVLEGTTWEEAQKMKVCQFSIIVYETNSIPHIFALFFYHNIAVIRYIRLIISCYLT